MQEHFSHRKSYNIVIFGSCSELFDIPVNGTCCNSVSYTKQFKKSKESMAPHSIILCYMELPKSFLFQFHRNLNSPRSSGDLFNPNERTGKCKFEDYFNTELSHCIRCL